VSVSDIDDELAQKKSKAEYYAADRGRFRLEGVTVEVKSNHGVRMVELRDRKWACTCPFFQERGTCSHILAVREVVGMDSARVD